MENDKPAHTSAPFDFDARKTDKSDQMSFDYNKTMPPPGPTELTLVVAATRQMGIGRNGTLPWTGLRKEMAYFARVTKRLPASVSCNFVCPKGKKSKLNGE